MNIFPVFCVLCLSIPLISSAPATKSSTFYDAIIDKCPNLANDTNYSKKQVLFTTCSHLEGIEKAEHNLNESDSVTIRCLMYFYSFTQYCSNGEINDTKIDPSKLMKFEASNVCDNSTIHPNMSPKLKEILANKTLCLHICVDSVGWVESFCSLAHYYSNLRSPNVRKTGTEEQHLIHVKKHDDQGDKNKEESLPDLKNKPVQGNTANQGNTDHKEDVVDRGTVVVTGSQTNQGDLSKQKNIAQPDESGKAEQKEKLKETKPIDKIQQKGTDQEGNRAQQEEIPIEDDNQNAADNKKDEVAQPGVSNQLPNGNKAQTLNIIAKTDTKPQLPILIDQAKLAEVLNDPKVNSVGPPSDLLEDNNQENPSETDPEGDGTGLNPPPGNDDISDLENYEPPVKEGNNEKSFKPPETDDEPDSGSFPPEMEADSYFFTYFMLLCIIFIVGYVCYHNKQKILALILEGRRGKRQYRGKRPNSANYHKLDSNLEEAINSSCNKNTNNVIY